MFERRDNSMASLPAGSGPSRVSPKNKVVIGLEVRKWNVPGSLYFDLSRAGLSDLRDIYSDHRVHRGSFVPAQNDAAEPIDFGRQLIRLGNVLVIRIVG